MNRADAFLAAILKSPEDDTPRLVFADWLDDHDQPERGEFIRVQCELPLLEAKIAALQHAPWEWHRHVALRRRERELMPGDRLYPRGAKDDYDYVIVGWRRGFVEAVTCTAAAWQTHGPTLQRSQPIREVQLTDAPRQIVVENHGKAPLTVRGEGFIFDGGAAFVIQPGQVFRHTNPSPTVT